MASAPRKTPQGLEELEQRRLGLGPLQRRLLIFIDGQRTTAELQALMGKTEILPLLETLVANGCVLWPGGPGEAQASAPVLPAGSQPQAAMLDSDWPPPRSAKEVDMAKNFMINTLITFVGQYANPDLVKRVQAATDCSVLRDSFEDWKRCMETSSSGARRLQELETELRKVL